MGAKESEAYEVSGTCTHGRCKTDSGTLFAEGQSRIHNRDSRMIWVLGNPPGWEDLRNAQLFRPRPPLGLILGEDVSNSQCCKFTRHVLFRVRHVVVAIR